MKKKYIYKYKLKHENVQKARFYWNPKFAMGDMLKKHW